MKSRAVSRPTVRFLLAGLVNVAVTYPLFLALGAFMHHALAYSITYLFGIALAYVLSAKFVFGTGFGVRSALRFPFVYVAQYFFGLALLWFLVDVLSVPSYAAMAVVIVAGVPLTYLLSSLAMRRDE